MPQHREAAPQVITIQKSAKLPSAEPLSRMKITFRNKELHRLNIMVGIMLALIFTFFAFSFHPWMFSGLILSFIVGSKNAGVEFDSENNTYRKYDEILFSRKGTWKSIGKNKDLVILVKHGVQTTIGTMAVATVKRKGGFSELYLMDSSHIHRFFIDSSENHGKIERKAKMLSDKMGLTVKPYRPKN